MSSVQKGPGVSTHGWNQRIVQIRLKVPVKRMLLMLRVNHFKTGMFYEALMDLFVLVLMIYEKE